MELLEAQSRSSRTLSCVLVIMGSGNPVRLAGCCCVASMPVGACFTHGRSVPYTASSTLVHSGHCCCFNLPGVAEDKAGEGEGEEVDEGAEGEEGAALPAWPKYEGLAYRSEVQLPCSAADIAFPPPAAVVATI
jgi:hypothetical protein